jgi:hypothetical protein
MFRIKIYVDDVNRKSFVLTVLRIRIRDQIPFDPGSGIRNTFFRISNPGSQIRIFESLMTDFWIKSTIRNS